MGRIEDQIKKQQLIRMGSASKSEAKDIHEMTDDEITLAANKYQLDKEFQKETKQTLDETDLSEQEKQELMDELMSEEEEHVDSHYNHPISPEEAFGTYTPQPVFNDTGCDPTLTVNNVGMKYYQPIDNPGVGELTFNGGMQYCNPSMNVVSTTTGTELNSEMDCSFADYVKSQQEQALKLLQELSEGQFATQYSQESKVLQPRHTRHNDPNTIFVYGCSDCPFMRKKAFEDKILVTCHFNPEQEFVLAQGHSADELDHLMRSNCQLRKQIEINIRLI